MLELWDLHDNCQEDSVKHICHKCTCSFSDLPQISLNHCSFLIQKPPDISKVSGKEQPCKEVYLAVFQWSGLQSTHTGQITKKICCFHRLLWTVWSGRFLSNCSWCSSCKIQHLIHSWREDLRYLDDRCFVRQRVKPVGRNAGGVAACSAWTLEGKMCVHSSIYYLS